MRRSVVLPLADQAPGELGAFLALLERAAGFLSPEERSVPCRRRVNGAWYDHLLLAAKEGAVVLGSHGTLFAGLGFGPAELRADPKRLHSLLTARAAIAELLESIDRAILFYKERIARRTRALQRSLAHKLDDDGLPAAPRAALRDAALPFVRLFESHNKLKEGRRQKSLRLRSELRALMTPSQQQTSSEQPPQPPLQPTLPPSPSSPPTPRPDEQGSTAALPPGRAALALEGSYEKKDR